MPDTATTQPRTAEEWLAQYAQPKTAQDWMDRYAAFEPSETATIPALRGHRPDLSDAQRFLDEATPKKEPQDVAGFPGREVAAAFHVATPHLLSDEEEALYQKYLHSNAGKGAQFDFLDPKEFAAKEGHPEYEDMIRSILVSRAAKRSAVESLQENIEHPDPMEVAKRNLAGSLPARIGAHAFNVVRSFEEGLSGGASKHLYQGDTSTEKISEALHGVDPGITAGTETAGHLAGFVLGAEKLGVPAYSAMSASAPGRGGEGDYARRFGSDVVNNYAAMATMRLGGAAVSRLLGGAAIPSGVRSFLVGAGENIAGVAAPQVKNDTITTPGLDMVSKGGPEAIVPFVVTSILLGGHRALIEKGSSIAEADKAVEEARPHVEQAVHDEFASAMEAGAANREAMMAEHGGKPGEGIQAAPVAQEPAAGTKIEQAVEPTAKGVSSAPVQEPVGAAERGGLSIPTREDVSKGFQRLKEAARFAFQRVPQSVADFWKGTAAPMTTRLYPRVADSLVQLAGSDTLRKAIVRRAAKYVVGDGDANKIGWMLAEENLRTKGKSMLGEDAPFASEEEVQAYAKSDEYRQAAERWKEVFGKDVEPLYLELTGKNPDEIQKERGVFTGARVNMKALLDENTGQVTFGSRAGNPENVKIKKSPFAREFKGTATSYETDVASLLDNSLRQLAPAQYKRLVRSMIDNGAAKKMGKDGVRPEFAGKPGVRYRIADPKSFLMEKVDEETGIGEPVVGRTKGQDIYVDPRIEREFRAAANLDVVGPPPGSPLHTIATIFNKTQLAALTDAVAHSVNISAQVTRPGVFGKFIRNAMSGEDYQIEAQERLARLGVARNEQSDGDVFGLGGFLHRIDRAGRDAILEDYDAKAQKGIVADTDAGRRNAVNTLGNYQVRTQDYLTRVAKAWGLAPFAVAGKTMTANAFRNLPFVGTGGYTSDGGVKNAAALRALVLSKWASVATISGVWNSIYAGTPVPDGIPVFSLYTGEKNGRPTYNDTIARVFGVRQATNYSGIGPTIESLREGMPLGQAMKAGVTSAANRALTMVRGPLPQAVFEGLTGRSMDVSLRPLSEESGPTAQNAKEALLRTNNIVQSIRAALEGDTEGAFSEQVGMFMNRKGQSPQDVETKPERVQYGREKQAIEFLKSEIRKKDPDKQEAWLDDRLGSLDLPEDVKGKIRAEVMRSIGRYESRGGG